MLAVTATASTASRAGLERIGRWMIVAGVLVWGVWLIVKLTGGQPHLEYFLPTHLLGVIPGAIFSRWSKVQRWRNRRSS
jgi:hypothetical protein